MEDSEIELLKFRRQYIIAPNEIDCPFMSKSIDLIGNYSLYAHQDLKTFDYAEAKTRIILLGDMFDYENPEKDNPEILKDIYDSDFDRFVEKTFKYSGRFVLLYIQHSTFKIIHDATATRKVYYFRTESSCWFASQPYLLARVLNLKPSADPSKIAFYHSDDFHRLHNSNIGNTTRYDEMYQLMPNHYYDLDLKYPVRYWPNKRIEYLRVSRVAQECAQMMQGYVESIANRYDIMLPVTAGKDSRTLVAATRNIREKVFYYINDEKRVKKRDVKIPRRMFARLNINFNIINPCLRTEKAFRKVYYENNEYAISSFLPHIFNYYKNFSDKVNLPGNNASSAFDIFTDKEMKPTAINFANLYKVAQYPHAISCYESWLSGCRDTCNQNNINIINLFYWEERLGNWGTQIQLDKDIAQEDFNPYNSRQLIQLYLSVNPQYLELSNYYLPKKIIRILWPELLTVPINPGTETFIRKILIFIQIHGMVIKYSHRLSNFLSLSK